MKLPEIETLIARRAFLVAPVLWRAASAYDAIHVPGTQRVYWSPLRGQISSTGWGLLVSFPCEGPPAHPAPRVAGLREMVELVVPALRSANLPSEIFDPDEFCIATGFAARQLAGDSAKILVASDPSQFYPALLGSASYAEYSTPLLYWYTQGELRTITVGELIMSCPLGVYGSVELARACEFCPKAAGDCISTQLARARPEWGLPVRGASTAVYLQTTNARELLPKAALVNAYYIPPFLSNDQYRELSYTRSTYWDDSAKHNTLAVHHVIEDRLEVHNERQAGMQEGREARAAVCGGGKCGAPCVLKSKSCRRWVPYWRRGCKRRWASHAEILRNGLDNIDKTHDREALIPHIKCSLLHAGMLTRLPNPETGRLAGFRYLGLRLCGRSEHRDANHPRPERFVHCFARAVRAHQNEVVVVFEADAEGLRATLASVHDNDEVSVADSISTVHAALPVLGDDLVFAVLDSAAQHPMYMRYKGLHYNFNRSHFGWLQPPSSRPSTLARWDLSTTPLQARNLYGSWAWPDIKDVEDLLYVTHRLESSTLRSDTPWYAFVDP